MVMQWTPRETEGSHGVCAGVVAYEDARPYPSTAYLAVSWILFGIVNVLFLGGVIGKFYYRNDPRFHIIRPMILSALSYMYQTAWSIALILNVALPRRLPCAAFLFFMLLGVAGLGVGYAIRLLNFVLQSQFEVTSSRYRMRVTGSTSHNTQNQDDQVLTMNEDDEDPILVVHPNPILPKIHPNRWGGKTCLCDALIAIAQVVFGCKDLDSLTLEELVLAKRARMSLVAAVLLPSIIAFVVIIAVDPQYRYCAGCAFFAEPMIALFVAMVPYVAVAIRLLFIVRKEQFPDRQGIVYESNGVIVMVVPATLAWMILIIIDPGDGEYNRALAYEWFAAFTLAFYWWFTTGLQLIKAYQQRRQLNQAREWWARNQQRVSAVRTSTSYSSHAGQNHTWWGVHNGSTHSGSQHQKTQYPHNGGSRVSNNSVVPEDFLDVLDHDDGLKDEFTQFAISRYAVENLHFVNDARAFKLFFGEKAPNWRKQKALFLYRTYVDLGSPMEVNISDSTRKAITHEIQSNLARNDLENAFDAAVNDITSNVLRQMWLEFLHERRSKQNKRRRESSSPLPTATGVHERTPA